MAPKKGDETIEKISNQANAVADEMNARVILYSAPIDDSGYGKLLQAMSPCGDDERPNVVLFLTTNGGLADSAYKIARLLQNASRKFILVVPSYCKSAGTLVALGANEIVMSLSSELGPLDVQLLQRDEIGQRRSGLVVRTAFEGLARETFDTFSEIMLGIKGRSANVVSFETASRIAATMAAQVMAPVYSQINPEALGSDLRDLHVAMAYGSRLADKADNAKPGAIEKLVSGYPSHSFIIDSAEAEELFKRVTQPSKAVNGLIAELGAIAYAQANAIIRLDERGSTANGASDDGADGETSAETRPIVADGRESERPGDPGGERKGASTRDADGSKEGGRRSAPARRGAGRSSPQASD